MLAAGKCRWLLSGPDGPTGPLAVRPQSGAWGFILSPLLGCSGPCAQSGSLPCLNIPGFPGSHQGAFATLLLTVPSVGPAVPACPACLGRAVPWGWGPSPAEGSRLLLSRAQAWGLCQCGAPGPVGCTDGSSREAGGCPQAYPCLSVLTCPWGAVRRWGCEDWVYWGSSHWTAMASGTSSSPRGRICLPRLQQVRFSPIYIPKSFIRLKIWYMVVLVINPSNVSTAPRYCAAATKQVVTGAHWHQIWAQPSFVSSVKSRD